VLWSTGQRGTPQVVIVHANGWQLANNSSGEVQGRAVGWLVVMRRGIQKRGYQLPPGKQFQAKLTDVSGEEFE